MKRDPMRRLGSQVGLLLVLVITGAVMVFGPEPDPDFGNLFWPGAISFLLGVTGLARLYVKHREGG